MANTWAGHTTWLAMEALRENAISGSPDLNGKLGDVMLAAPDIDLNVFRQQLARLDRMSSSSSPRTTGRFRSRTLAGDRPRLGALDPNNPSDRVALEDPGVKAYDLSRESTGLIGHGTYADAPRRCARLARRSPNSGRRTPTPRPCSAKNRSIQKSWPSRSRH